jgi:hypothetical protein
MTDLLWLVIALPLAGAVLIAGRLRPVVTLIVLIGATSRAPRHGANRRRSAGTAPATAGPGVAR